MSEEHSFFPVFVEDPRWQAGAIAAGVGALLWLKGTPGEMTALDYVASGLGLAGLLLVGLSLRHAAVSTRVSRDGMEVRGRVTRIARLWPTTSYALRYRFRDSSGAEVEGRRFLSQVDAFEWREGDEGEVRFDSGDSAKSAWLGTPNFLREPVARPAAPPAASVSAAPRQPAAAPLPTQSTLIWRSRSIRYAFIIFPFFMFTALALAVMTVGLVTGSSEDVGGYLFYALIVVSLLAAGLFKLRSGLREVAERQRVLRVGVAAKAAVTTVEKKVLKGKLFDIPIGWIVRYSYTDGTGASYHGESGFLARHEATRWRSGDRCPVLFDPGNPESSVWAA